MKKLLLLFIILNLNIVFAQDFNIDKMMKKSKKEAKILNKCNKKAARFCENVLDEKCLRRKKMQIGSICVEKMLNMKKISRRKGPMFDCMGEMVKKCKMLKGSNMMNCMMQAGMNLSKSCQSTLKIPQGEYKKLQKKFKNKGRAYSDLK